MTRNYSFFVLSVVASLALLAGAVGPVAAQAAPNNTTDQATDQAADRVNSTGVRIDENTVILKRSYNEDTGRATLKIRSETLQEIVLTDSGAFVEGGEVAQNSQLLKPGETAKISVSVTKTHGLVGVGVNTKTTLYAVVIEDIETDRQPVDYGTVQMLLLMAATGGAGMTYRVVKKRREDEDKGAERVL